MRACALTWGVVFGTLLILLGLSIILRAVFGINIPLFRIAFALLIIYLGIRVLMGGHFCRMPSHSAVFSDVNIQATSKTGEYNVVFGRGVIDLSKVDLSQGSRKAKVSTVFGTGIIKIAPDQPVKIESDAVFASARFPDGNVISFGKYVYTTPSYREDTSSLTIKADVVFGELKIEN